MANIPTAQIPNVQSAVGNSPMASPSAVRTPNLQTMPVLGREVFDGVGTGMVGLSRGVWEGAQFLTEFSSKMSAANDNFQFAAADRTFSEAVANHEVEAATLPPDKHLELWESKYLPKVQSSISGMRVTPDGRARLDAYMQRQTGSAYAAIKTGAYKQFLEQGLQESDAYQERAINEGRYEDAYAQLERDKQSGLRSESEVNQRTAKIAEDVKVSTMTQAIQQNPAYWSAELAKYQKEGKNPHNLRPEQVLQFRRMSEGVHGQLLDDLNNEMLTRLETDSAAITNDQIEEFYNRPEIRAPRELINKMKEYRGFKYVDTPEGQAEQATRFSDLWQKIFSYDAEKDISMADPDTHKREYQRLISEIVSTAPEGQRKPFMDTLDGMVSQANQGRKSRADEITRGLVNITADLAKWGQLGAVVEYKKEKRGDVEVSVPKDPQAQLAVEAKRLEITNDIRAMLRENPDLTEEQAMERFKGILENRLDGGALFMQQPDEESWWNTLGDIVTWGGIAMNPTANNPNVMTAGVSWGSSSLMDGIKDADEPLPPVEGMPQTVFGYKIRQPYESENKFFAANPDTTGMAAEDGQIVLNPYSSLSTQQQMSVATNEAARLFMQEQNISPNFEVTPEQEQFFEKTPYSKNSVAMRQTIVARIIAGDGSAGETTSEQRKVAEKVRRQILNSSPVSSTTPAAIVAGMPPAKQSIAAQIASMAEAEGLGQYTPHLMLLVAQESNFNPDQTISTSSARGLFQLLNADRKRYGSDSSLDGQIRAGLAKTKENINAARRALGRDPDPFELYVVHYQGIGAGPAILKNPDGDFRQTLNATGGKGHAAAVMKANPWLVRDNIQTNQDFIDWVRKRLSKKAADLGMA